MATFDRQVSPKAKPLRDYDLSVTLPRMTSRLPERARLRLREEITRRHVSQRDLASLLNWSQSRVGKILNGRVEMSMGDLEALCFAVDLAPTEVVRDHGLEFCAELTPTELRVLERMRQLPTPLLDAVMTLLDVKTKTRMQERRALSPVKKLHRTRT